jgi:monomeric sarcosine oxidase
VTPTFRYAVIGAGGIGSAAAYWLSRIAGPDVVCLEQWTPGHGRGASEDHSRIIRLGYHAPQYTALTRDSYAAWDEVASESGVALVQRTGMLNLAEPGTDGAEILANYEHAMTTHDIAYERLDARGVMRRWPQFHLDDDRDAIYQPDGGILDIRKGVAAQLALARGHGATVVAQAGVTAIDDAGPRIRLQTTAGPFEAEQVIVCAGAWTGHLLATQLGVRWPIRLTREQVTYFATTRLRDFAADRFPIWIWHGDNEFYGFPVYGEVATKAAWEVCDPEVGLDASSWEPDPYRVGHLTEFLDRVLPGYTGPELYTRCCLYDMPPDRGFVIDRVPGHPQISVAVGAGHAAKFASLFGRILAELTTDGASQFPIEAFRADRPALTDPDYTPSYRLGAEVTTA